MAPPCSEEPRVFHGAHVKTESVGVPLRMRGAESYSTVGVVGAQGGVGNHMFVCYQIVQYKESMQIFVFIYLKPSSDS